VTEDAGRIAARITRSGTSWHTGSGFLERRRLLERRTFWKARLPEDRRVRPESQAFWKAGALQKARLLENRRVLER